MGMMSELPRTPLSEVPPDAQHRVALLHAVPAGELLVHEIYLSVQGESTFAGLPCVFVRTSVCDLRCGWCDTPHAFNRGERMSRAAVLARALAFACPLVVITGGDPLLQPDVLCAAGKTVLLETSGAHDVRAVDPRVHVVMDLKCPDSGESHRNRWANLAALKPTDQIKFVIASRRDWDWAAAAVREHNLDERFVCLASCVFGAVRPVELVGWLLESGLHRVRVQLQMHKYIWDPAARGV
jgi:7-carboxy-7-deazaguanine synthase